MPQKADRTRHRKRETPWQQLTQQPRNMQAPNTLPAPNIHARIGSGPIG